MCELLSNKWSQFVAQLLVDKALARRAHDLF